MSFNREYCRRQMELKRTDELIEILRRRDTDEWAPEAFEIIEEMLKERNAPLPLKVVDRRRVASAAPASVSEQTDRLPSPEELSSILLDAARLDLYRVNAFRVAGLPVGATARDMLRQAEKLKVMEKLGGGTPCGGPLSLDPAPDSDAMREAMQRLHDPERRLVDEFFWFWPHQLGQSKSDEALAALGRGDVKAAAEIWAKQENYHSDSNVSMHNLAVLSHATALDLEHVTLTKPLLDEQKKQRDLCWQQAFQRWKILLQHEGFWSRLTARIRDLDDPRLTTGTARRMQVSLPLALLSINAQLAVRAAERGDTTEAKRHLQIMSTWGEEDVVEEALRRAVQPIRERIKTLCKAAEPEADGDPVHADGVTRRLLEQARPLLGVLDALLPAGNPTRDGAHDEVALRALACQIQFGNKTENWKVSLELLEQTLPIAASESARGRIEENIKTVKGNLDYQLQYGTCWFCKQSRPEDAAVAEVKMHGNVIRTPTGEGQIQWQNLTVKIPRCSRCKSAHARVSAFTRWGSRVGGLAGLAGCSAIVNANQDAWLGGLFVLGICIAIGSGIGHAIDRAFSPKVTRPESIKTEFPAVKTMISQGWAIGEKPPGVQ